jgi:molybdopterin synthase sulfur carrier subunit
VLTVRFFSLLREALDVDTMTLDWDTRYGRVEELKQSLIASGGVQWEEQLTHPNLIHAVNQVVVEPTHPLQDGDEIAFFPPMTGG